MSRFRALGRDLLVYGFGEIAVKAFGFITLPVYTRLFTPAEYGVYGYVSTIIGLTAAILILGGDSAFARFFFSAKTVEDRRVLTTTWIAFLSAWSVAAVACLVPFGASFSTLAFGTPDRGLVLVLAVGAVPISIVNRMCGQILRNQFRPAAYTALNVASMAVTVSLSIAGVALLRLGVTGLFAGALVAELIQLPVRLWATRALFGRRISLRLLRELLAFGLPLVPTSLAYWVFLTSDRIVLANLSTLEQVGFYAVAATIVSVPSVAINAIGQAWSPHVVAAFEADQDEARHLVGRVGLYLVIGFSLLCVGVTAFAPEILGILATGRYAPAAVAVGPLALAMVAQATTSVTAVPISLLKRTPLLAGVAWIAAGINVVLNLILDGRFGMAGAAWATTAAYTGLTVAYYVVSQRLWPVRYDGRRIAFAVLALLAFTVAAPFLPGLGLVAAILLKGAYFLAFLVVLVAVGALDRTEIARFATSVAHALRPSGVAAP